VTHIRGNRRAGNLINYRSNRSKMLEDKKTDHQIMETLRIPHRTYYRYKSRIINQDKQQWAEVVKESLEFRVLKILQSLQWAYSLNKKIAEDRTAQASVRIKASQVIIDTQVNIYYLLKRGPRLG
jgi:hypothetical protein